MGGRRDFGQQGDQQELRYLMKWKGFGIEHNTQYLETMGLCACPRSNCRILPESPRSRQTYQEHRIPFHPFQSVTVPGHHFLKGGVDVRGLPIPDPHQKTTPLHTSSLRDVRTPSPEITESCQPSPAVGQLLIYLLSYHFIIYYGTICYISPPFSVLVYILQQSPFFPFQIPARSVSTPYFTFLLHIIILFLDPC